jgi:hypothetical protein
MASLNFLVALVATVPIVAVLGSCGGDLMLTLLIVVSLVPLGYIFVKFF